MVVIRLSEDRLTASSKPWMLRLVGPLLTRLEPETAHQLTVKALQWGLAPVPDPLAHLAAVRINSAAAARIQANNAKSNESLTLIARGSGAALADAEHRNPFPVSLAVAIDHDERDRRRPRQSRSDAGFGLAGIVSPGTDATDVEHPAFACLPILVCWNCSKDRLEPGSPRFIGEDHIFEP